MKKQMQLAEPQEHDDDDFHILVPSQKEDEEPVLQEEKLRATFTLERRSDLKRSMVLILVYLVLEIGKQMSNFGLSRKNEGIYPLPSSLLVVMIEVTKLIVVLLWAQVTNVNLTKATPSFKFCVPAGCYFVTNLLYLHALTYVSPPIWMVLIQTRTLYTAAAYKVVFGRAVSRLQVVGCVLVVSSIPLARLSSLQDANNSITAAILLVSQVCALLSTAASVAVELLLKNDGRSFCEQQMWLYLCGSVLGCAAFAINTDLTSIVLQLQELCARGVLVALLVTAVLTSSLGGLCVPVIVRNLDTIVKDYLAALNNLALCVVTALAFPDEFSLSWLYGASLTTLLFGIFLYEKKYISWPS